MEEVLVVLWAGHDGQIIFVDCRGQFYLQTAALVVWLGGGSRLLECLFEQIAHVYVRV